MFCVECALNVEHLISFKYIFKHIFIIISLSYKSLKDQNNYIQQLLRDKPISSSCKNLKIQ